MASDCVVVVHCVLLVLVLCGFSGCPSWLCIGIDCVVVAHGLSTGDQIPQEFETIFNTLADCGTFLELRPEIEMELVGAWQGPC